MTRTRAAGLTAALCASYFISCAGAPAAALSGGDSFYSLNQYGGLTIVEYRGSKKNIVIPTTINNMDVNVIGRGAFAGKGITGAELPETIIRIEDRAFMNNKLKSIKLPAGLKFIGDEAFKKNRIETINLPEGVAEIGFRAFEKNRVAELALPSSLKTAGDYCFADNRVKSVEFSENIDVIPAGMFERNNIEILRLPDAVRLIGAKAFAGNPIEALSFWGGEHAGKGAFADAKLKVIGIAANVVFDSPREMGLGFQNAYKSMGGAAGIYYKQSGDFWWIKED
ncbi:MAG: leucine-rich repeat domain-containing protein [Spirochaetaceae bacterium]|jgi:virulence-associated protein VagC|nr:leucine-rich repeat domain-containing protein [Spirochaetaceae bacterium]